jgi:hypothetical protein
MNDPIHPSVKANFSRERRRHVIALLRGDRVLETVGPDAQLLYAVGGLVCDEAGRVSESHLRAALRDPSIVATARELIRKAAA